MSERDGSKFAESLKRATAVAWQGLGYRFELLAAEFHEDRRRLLVLVALAQVALFAAFMAFLCLNVLVFVIYWDRHRLAVAVILSALYLAVAVAVGASVRWRARALSRPFDATLEELRKDRAALKRGDS